MRSIALVLCLVLASISPAMALEGANAVDGKPEAHTGVQISPGAYQFVTIAAPPGPPTKRGSVFYPGEEVYLVLDDDWETLWGAPIPGDARVGIVVKKSGQLLPVYARWDIAAFSDATADFVTTGLNAADLEAGSYDLFIVVHAQGGACQIEIPLQIYWGPDEFGVGTIPVFGAAAIPAGFGAVMLVALKRRGR